LIRLNSTVLTLCLGFVALLGTLAGLLCPFGLKPFPAAVCGVLIAAGASLAANRVRYVSLETVAGAFLGTLAGADT
jgi:hypothetical protein